MQICLWSETRQVRIYDSTKHLLSFLRMKVSQVNLFLFLIFIVLLCWWWILHALWILLHFIFLQRVLVVVESLFLFMFS